MSHRKIPRKTEVARAKSRAKRPIKPGNSLGFDPRRDQAGDRPRPAETAQGDNDRRHHEGDGLAAALGPRLLCGGGAQEARLDPDIGEGRGRTRLSCACRTAVQIEAEDLRATGRLAMASMDTRAIEGEIDRIRSLGLEELRREWWRLYHTEPPRISRDLLVLALGYRLQEIAHGGLGKAVRRKLQTMAKALRTTGRVGPTPSLSLKPGARLVREWENTRRLSASRRGTMSRSQARFRRSAIGQKFWTHESLWPLEALQHSFHARTRSQAGRRR
jgi:hypothetical protein